LRQPVAEKLLVRETECPQDVPETPPLHIDMKVIQDKQYCKLFKHFVETGGTHGKKATKAADVIQKLAAGIQLASATTNNGESRIRHCVKYDLGNGFRLITVQYSGCCFVMFMGDHEASDRWLDQNRGRTIHRDPVSKEVRFLQVIESGSVPLSISSSDSEKRHYLEKLSDVDWSRVIPNPLILRMAKKLRDDQCEEDIWEDVSCVQEQDARSGQLLSSIIPHLHRNELDEARMLVRAHLGEVEAEGRVQQFVIDAEDLNSASNSMHLVVINDLTEEQREALWDPLKFQDWMLFLHPDQQRVVNEDFEKAALLTGVSGSGKTCVLVHRAKRLATTYPDERVLVLTLNRSLARLIKHLVGTLCSPGINARIEVLPFHDYLSNVLQSLSFDAFLEILGDYTGHHEAVSKLRSEMSIDKVKAIFEARDESEMFSEFRKFVDLGIKDNLAWAEAFRLVNFVDQQAAGTDAVHYIYEELELVRSAFNAYDDYIQYLDGYERVGRSIGFQRERREMVLKVLRAWEHYQINKGFLDHMGLTQAVSLALDVDAGDSLHRRFRYRSVLVDEFQDFSTLDLKLLKRIPTDYNNGLFLTGDVAQKIYAKELNFSKAGLGSSDRICRRIQKNYRNSRQILKAADALLKSFKPPQDLDQELRVLDPELAARDSAKPISFHTNFPIKGAWKQAEEWLSEGNPGMSVCIASANTDNYPIIEILRACPHGLEATELTGDYLMNPQSVVVSDLTAIKGFEFSLVIIVGLQKNSFPVSGRHEAEQWRDALRLYVAITRGRDEVQFIYVGEASPFLVAMGDFVEWRQLDEQSVAATPTPTPAPTPAPIPSYTPTPTRKRGRRQVDLRSGQAAARPPQPTPKVVTNNGMHIASVPRNMSQIELAEFLKRPQTDIAVQMQQNGVFPVPNRPLADHHVKAVLERYGFQVAFQR